MTNLAQTLSVPRDAARQIINIGIQHGVLQQYYSYWRVCVDAKTPFFRYVDLRNNIIASTSDTIPETLEEDIKETENILAQELLVVGTSTSAPTLKVKSKTKPKIKRKK